ncbi:two-component regulator propeller domain-containing protein [Flagellimonas sp.]|uniref:helix-turn-helix and ligand-binding sensor domain-containing protein n=1 Tax=Flagellimonas sp. TaxID=2058762 RepID=UPI003B5C91ED
MRFFPFFVILVFLIAPICSQELPPIQNYTPADYYGENQNWAISQSSDGFIYIANNHSLLESDGIQWNKYPTPNGSVIRNVTVVNDKIYTGCYMEFGFWTKNSKGKLVYTSLKDKLTEPLIEDEEFWNIVPVEDWILFQSLNRIYIYSLTNENFRVIEAETDKAQIFNLTSGVYFQRKNQGVFKITEGAPSLVTQDVQIRNKTLIGLFEYQSGLVYVTADSKLYRAGGDDQLVEWNIPAQSDLQSLNIYSSLRLKDGNIVLGTISNGVYLISKEGRLILRIDQQQGLNNNTILSIYEDQDSNLWLGHDNGLSVVNLDSYFNEYVDNEGKLGVVYAARVYNGKLYLGTNQGLFWTELNGISNFKLIKGTEGQVWCLTEIQGNLFCGHHNGTYLVKDDGAELISNFPGTWDVKVIEGEPNYLLQGNYGGLSILENTNGKWKYRNTLEGFSNSSRFFEFSAQNELYINHEYKGVFRLKLEEDFRKVRILSKEESKGIASSLVKFKDETIYATTNGVFKLEPQGQFIADSTLTQLFHYKEQDALSILMNDVPNQRLWRFGQQEIMFVSPSKFDSGYNRTVVPLPTGLRNNLGVAGFENITNIGSDKYLIGSSNGYVTLNLEKLKLKEQVIHLNKVNKYSYGQPVQSMALDSVALLENKENNLHFSYSVPAFDKYTAVEYQYKLEGLYDNWSDWSTAASVTFENLPYGDFTFYARSRIGSKMSNNTATYSFSIARPWYLTNLMLTIYLLSTILGGFMIHNFYRRYYRKRQEKLIQRSQREMALAKAQNEKEIIKLKNERLKEDFKNKSNELAASTMSIIKKNELLSKVKEQLVESVDDKDSVRPIIHIIDKNLNQNDDWELFKEAFNNADRKFLKKLKKEHPNLSPNDIRLCAYLRLNLSSKEIAPMFNISPRSVEIKRYRLRKKMNLSQDDNLTNYILGL